MLGILFAVLSSTLPITTTTATALRAYQAFQVRLFAGMPNLGCTCIFEWVSYLISSLVEAAEEWVVSMGTGCLLIGHYLGCLNVLSNGFGGFTHWEVASIIISRPWKSVYGRVAAETVTSLVYLTFEDLPWNNLGLWIQFWEDLRGILLRAAEPTVNLSNPRDMSWRWKHRWGFHPPSHFSLTPLPSPCTPCWKQRNGRPHATPCWKALHIPS